jgi:hypothetical protein
MSVAGFLSLTGIPGGHHMSDYQIGRKPEWVKPPEFTMEFKTIDVPLQGVYRTLVDRLSKEEPDSEGFHFLLGSLLRINMGTQRAIVRLIGSNEEKKFPFQAMVLVRTMVDSLFTIVALKTDPARRSRQFDLAGYRATLERHLREKERYGNEPNSQNHLSEVAKFLRFRASRLRLSPSEAGDPKKLPYWPIPSRMLREDVKDPISFSKEERDFLADVDEWHYGELSSHGRVQWGGMAFAVTATSDEQWVPGMAENSVIMESLLFMLMLLSEVEAQKKYGTNQDLRYIWVLLGDLFRDAREYYEMRYSSILS